MIIKDKYGKKHKINIEKIDFIIDYNEEFKQIKRNLDFTKRGKSNV